MKDWSFIEMLIPTFGNLVRDLQLRNVNVFAVVSKALFCSRYKMKGGEEKRKKNIGEQQETRFP